MDQPTAEKALKELEVLVGEWTLEAVQGGKRWPGPAYTSFEWLEGRQLLLQRTTIEAPPEAPNSVGVYGCDAASGTYEQLYSDDRGVCRVYEMGIGNGKWRMWREGEPFDQRFSATMSDDGNTITGRWELDEGDGWKPDFDVTYRRVS